MTEVASGRNSQMHVPASADGRLWLWWIAFTALGWTAGGALGVAVGSGAGILAAGAAGLVLGGLAAGLLQWVVLRRHIAAAGLWAPAYPAAAAGALLLGLAADRFLGVDAGWVLGAGAYGTIVGVFQWLVLQRQIERAGWWVLAATAGWVLGGPTAGILDAATGGDLGWAVLGAVYGAVTGMVLMRLLRGRRRQRPTEHSCQAALGCPASTPDDRPAVLWAAVPILTNLRSRITAAGNFRVRSTRGTPTNPCRSKISGGRRTGVIFSRNGHAVGQKPSIRQDGGFGCGILAPAMA